MPKLLFSVLCPFRGHLASQDGFTRERLTELLHKKELFKLWCQTCGMEWLARPEDIEGIRRELQKG